MGFIVQSLTPELADIFGIPNYKGVLVSRIFKDSPSEKAGLKRGDIIHAMDGQKINSPKDFHNQISSYSAGNKIAIEFIRNGKKKTIQLITTPIPERLAEELAKSWLGVKVSEITEKIAKKYNLFTRSGVVIIKLDRTSAMARIGISQGDIIRQINKQSIDGIPDFRKGSVEAMKRNSVLFLIQRGRYGYYVTVEP